MRGWRARIGVIYPADGLIDEEFWKLSPDGVSILLTRISVPDDPISVSMVTQVGETEEIEQAARALKITRPNVIIYACTSGSFVKGLGFDRKIAQRIEDASGTPAITTSTATVDALRALDIERVGVAAPYPDDVNKTLATFLDQNGFEVVTMKGLGFQYEWQIGNASPAEVYKLAKSADNPNIDGVFISCTGLPTVDILEELEHDIGKPVISANQASVWRALRMAGIRENSQGLGKLMRT